MRERAPEDGCAGARSGVQMCRRFCKVSGRTERSATRKSLRINGSLNCQENKAAEGATGGGGQSRRTAVITS